MWFIQDWRRVELRASLLIGLGTGGKRPARRRQFLGDIGRRRQVRLLALGLEGSQFGIHAVGAELGEFLFEIVVRAGVGQFVEGLGGGFFLGYGLFEAVQLREGVVGAAHPGHGLADLALGDRGVLARHQRARRALALVDLAFEFAHLLLQFLAGGLGVVHRQLHGIDLRVALRLLGQCFLGQILIAGIQRHAGAIFPLLGLPDVLVVLRL